MKKVFVYGKPGCQTCRMTKLVLEHYKIPYQEVDVDTDPDAAPRFKEAGYTTLPIVVSENETWAGFNPEKIREIYDSGR